jgi:hypothetical protein
MGFDAAALRGGLDVWREEVGDIAVARPTEATDSNAQRA